MDVVNQLHRILTLHETSISNAESTRDIGPILSALVDPLMQLVTVSASDLDPLSASVYYLNVYPLIQVNCLLAVPRGVELGRLTVRIEHLVQVFLFAVSK